MSQGVNKAILIGNLGRDPEIRKTPSGQKVASFSMATSESWKDKEGNKQSKSEWHNIVVWGNSAEFVANFMRKGSAVYVEGKITTRSWDDNDGNKKYRTEIVATQVQFVGGKNAESGQQETGGPTMASEPGVSKEPEVEDDLSF